MLVWVLLFATAVVCELLFTAKLLFASHVKLAWMSAVVCVLLLFVVDETLAWIPSSPALKWPENYYLTPMVQLVCYLWSWHFCCIVMTLLL